MRQFRPEVRKPERQRELSKEETALRIEALAIERKTAVHMLEEGRISKEQAALFRDTLEQIEFILSNKIRLWLMILKPIGRRMNNLLFRPPSARSGILPYADRQALRDMKLQTCSSVIEAFEKRPCELSEESTIKEIINHYRLIQNKCSMLSPRLLGKDEVNADVQRDLQWIAIKAEWDTVQSLYEEGKINRDIANLLRRSIRIAKRSFWSRNRGSPRHTGKSLKQVVLQTGEFSQCNV